MAEKTWSDLSDRQRNAIKIPALAELALKIAVLVDSSGGRLAGSAVRSVPGARPAVNTIGQECGDDEQTDGLITSMWDGRLAVRTMDARGPQLTLRSTGRDLFDAL